MQVMKSIHDPRYIRIIEQLTAVRKTQNVTQVELSKILGQPQSYVAKVENLERRLDLIELYDWITAVDYKPMAFFRDIGWIEG